MTASAVPYVCELREAQPRPTLAMRFRTPISGLSGRLGEIYGTLFHYMQEQGAVPAGPPYVAYYNMDMSNLDVEAGIPVTAALPGRGDIVAGNVPGGQQAVCLHVGPYGECGPAYDALMGWMAAHGYAAAGAAYEFYLNDPALVAPDALQTEIMFPVKPA